MPADDKKAADVSVATLRNMVRKNQLQGIIDELHELGMNRENKPGDRIAALKLVLGFAEASEGTEDKVAGKLPAATAKILAKLGAQRDREVEASKAPSTSDRPVLQDDEEGERVGDSGVDGEPGGEGEP